MRVRACGESAFIVDVASSCPVGSEVLDCVLDLTAQIGAAVDSGRVAGVVEVVPAAETLLVVCDPARVRNVVAFVSGLSPRAATQAPSTSSIKEIGVTYDGPDLHDVADSFGISVDAVVRWHQDQVWQVAFGGFAPGFFYLVGQGERREVARRETPRPKIPAGSVGLAGRFSGVYPNASPGGWQLIGRTDAVLFDVDRTPPALLAQGMGVRFVDSEGRV